MERSPVSNYSISKRIMHLKIGNVSLKKKNSKYQPFKRTPKNICLLVILSTPCISTCQYTGLAKNKTKPRNILIVLKKLRNTNKSIHKVYQININIQRTIFHFNLFMIHVCFEKVLFYIPETVVLERTFF